MTNHSYTCPVGVEVVITVRGLSTTVKIGTTRGRHKITVEGKTDEEEGKTDKEETIKANFKITFYFPTEKSLKKCFVKGKASFVGTAKIEYLVGENSSETSEINEGVSFSKPKGKAGERYCQEIFNENNYSETFGCVKNPKLLALNIRKVTVKGALTVNMSCFQKTNLGKYLGNKNPSHMEIHDLKNIKKGCKMDEILEKHKVYFNSIKEGLDEGFNGCFYCLPKYHTE